MVNCVRKDTARTAENMLGQEEGEVGKVPSTKTKFHVTLVTKLKEAECDCRHLT